jgi:hypothetical protein
MHIPFGVEASSIDSATSFVSRGVLIVKHLQLAGSGNIELRVASETSMRAENV